MSNKTSFKRIALAVVVALGFGLLSTAPASNAAIVGQTLTLGASSATVAQGETATVSVTLSYTPTDAVKDSVTVLSSCVPVSGASCPTSSGDSGKFFWGPAPDSATSVSVLRTSAFTAVTGHAYGTSFILSGTTNAAAVSATVSFKMVVPTDQAVGTYTYTIYTSSSTGGAAASPTTSDKSATFAVTVTAANTGVTSARTYITNSTAGTNYWMTRSATPASQDSALVVDRGSATSSTLTQVASVGVIALNSAGETRAVTQSLNICATTGCVITASLSGPGALSSVEGASSLNRVDARKSVTMRVFNNDYTSRSQSPFETLSVFSDGTAGTGTITFYNGSTSIGSVSLIFTGDPASAMISLNDTTVAVGQSNVSIIGFAKDSAGNAYSNTGKSLYVYASDTKVVTGALSTNAAQFTQRAASVQGAATACSYVSASGYFNCGLTIADTGTATLVLRDSWSVAASSWASNEITLTALGAAAQTYTVAFDKTTYAPGERAIVTITGKDTAGRAVSNGAAGTGLTVTITDTPDLGNSPKAGTNAAGDASSSTFKGYVENGVESGIETRVVTMPTYGGDVTFELSYTPAVTLSSVPVKVVATAKVVNPQDALIAAAQAAADSATDAANEAIDAANAATDAANLSAEAADAATVAAEEARDAADAATAAVEELATQVATLMAALKAQITTLANTVAKIAKKVKA